VILFWRQQCWIGCCITVMSSTFAGEAPTLAAAANISAFNLANAIGAYLGGETLRAGFDLPAVNVTGALITAVGLLFALLLVFYERKRSTQLRIDPVA
jgi:DHA1 family inner membrane transport protein